MNENTTSVDIYTGNAGRYFRFETDGYPTSESDYPTSGSDAFQRSDYKPELLTPSTESGFIYRFPSVLYRNGSKKADMTDDDELGDINSTSQFLIEKTFGDTYIFRDGVTFEYAAQGARTFIFGRRYTEYHADVAAFDDTTNTWVSSGCVPTADFDTNKNCFIWKTRDNTGAIPNTGISIDVDKTPAFFTYTFGDKYDYHCGRLFTYSGAYISDSGENPADSPAKPIKNNTSLDPIRSGHGQTYNYGTGYTENLIADSKGNVLNHGVIEDYISDIKSTIDSDISTFNSDFNTTWNWSNSVVELTLGNVFDYYNGAKVEVTDGNFSEIVKETRHRHAGSSYEYVGSESSPGNCTSEIWANPTTTVHGDSTSTTYGDSTSTTYGNSTNWQRGVTTSTFFGVHTDWSISATFSGKLSGGVQMEFGALNAKISASLLTLDINLGNALALELKPTKFKKHEVDIDVAGAYLTEKAEVLESSGSSVAVCAGLAMHLVGGLFSIL
jgi:hypothetical protein